MVTLFTSSQKLMLAVQYSLSVIVLIWFVILNMWFHRTVMSVNTLASVIYIYDTYYVHALVLFLSIICIIVVLVLGAKLIDGIDHSLNYFIHLLLLLFLFVISNSQIRAFYAKLSEIFEYKNYSVVHNGQTSDLDTVSVFQYLNTQVPGFGLFYTLINITRYILPLVLLLILGLTLKRLNIETKIFSRINKEVDKIRKVYRPMNLEIDPKEFSELLNGVLKSSRKLDLEEFGQMTNQTPVFWKKIIYSMIGSDDIDGEITENMFILAKSQSKDEFIYTLGKSVELDMEKDMQSDQVPNIVKERRCCRMNGRLGDNYCNLCGKVIPEEFKVNN